MIVTPCPAFLNFDSVPPQPLSGSSGWPPTQTIFFGSSSAFLFSKSSEGRLANPSPRAPAFFTNSLRVLDNDGILLLILLISKGCCAFRTFIQGCQPLKGWQPSLNPHSLRKSNAPLSEMRTIC